MATTQHGFKITEYRGRTIEPQIVCGSDFTVKESGEVVDKKPKVDFYMVFDPDLVGINGSIGYFGGYDTLNEAKRDILRMDKELGIK